MAVPTVPMPPPESWQVIGRSVRGDAHIRKDIENQDNIDWVARRGQVALALADGHGSAKSFRSAEGSRIAVDVALSVAELLMGSPPPGDRRLFLSVVKDQLQTDIPRQIVQYWTKRVDGHLEQHPFTEQELATLLERDGPESLRRVEQDNRLAYGSTLITAIALESFAVFWQIGDGDVLTISNTGEVTRPVPGDARLIGNETTSLCSAGAARMFRHAVLGTPAPLIMLSTDGFANSFADDAGFFKFGSDVSEIIAAEGLKKVESSLPDWLPEISRRGSGDDISLGIICRPWALVPVPVGADTTPAPRTEPAPPPEPRPVLPGGPQQVPVLPKVVEPRQRGNENKTLVADNADTKASRNFLQRTVFIRRNSGRTRPQGQARDSGPEVQDHPKTLPADLPPDDKRNQR